jgi:serine/threonine protein kinase
MSDIKTDQEQGTVRLDDNNATVKLNDDSGTVRLEEGSNTVKLQSEGGAVSAGGVMPQQMAMIRDKATDHTGELFSPGQIIDINNKQCTIESVISMSSGEAVIYKITIDGKHGVLKYYKLGTASPKTVLSVIKSNPKNKIVKLFDFGHRNNQDYEIMEYAEGGTLDQYLKENGPIKDTAKLKYFVGQIIEGLNQLHNELRIIYQDLKPENIYFLDAQKSTLVLGDFGISGVLEPGKNEATVTANATTVYAAPELGRTGNEKNAIVGPAVDYFALGITMLHLWDGTTPFKGIPEAERSRLIRNEEVKFPQDMSAECVKLIQGLIDPLPKSRWGNQHVKKWLAGESLETIVRKTSITYEPRMFNETENYANPAELAELMDKYPDKGKQYLFNNILAPWIEKSGNDSLLIDINIIISTYAADKDTALYLAIYTLDPARPFVTNGGKSCSMDKIADALMTESAYYMEDLKKANARLYLYMEAVEGSNGKKAAEKFRKYFDEYSPRHAFSLVYLDLQEDDGRSIAIGSKTYQNPEEVAAETDNLQIGLIKKAIQEEDSLFLVWLSNQWGDFFTSTVAYENLPAPDKFFLLGKFKFLSYKEFDKNWEQNALSDLCSLINERAGRIDLFEAYAAQGLPFSGQMPHDKDCDWNPTALGYLTSFFEGVTNNDTEKGMELVRFLHSHGANINEESGNGELPLSIAVLKRNAPLVKLFLELGANPDKVDSKDSAPLMLALYQWSDNGEEKETSAESERIAIANMLLEQNANINLTDEDGRTPLYLLTCFLSSRKTVAVAMETILKKGAKTEILLKGGYCSPLMQAAYNNNIEAAELLLDYGAKKDFVDIEANTAFTYAAQMEHTQMMELVDPGKELVYKCGLPMAAKKIVSVLTVAMVFLTMDILAKIMLMLHLSHPVLLVCSLLFSHILSAYTFIIAFGLREYLIRLRGAFNFVGRGLLYLVGVPVFFPISVLILQALTRTLPPWAGAALAFPAEIINRIGNAPLMLLIYLVIMGGMMTLVMFISKTSDNLAKVWRIYKKYA